MKLRTVALLCLVAPLMLAGPLTLADAQEGEATTPDAAIVKVCTACHDMDIVTNSPKGVLEWQETFQVMRKQGANGTPKEMELALQWVYENMTPVGVNTSDAETLAAALSTTKTVADAIIARRETQKFKDLAELLETYPSLNAAYLKNRPLVFF